MTSTIGRSNAPQPSVFLRPPSLSPQRPIENSLDISEITGAESSSVDKGVPSKLPPPTPFKDMFFGHDATPRSISIDVATFLGISIAVGCATAGVGVAVITGYAAAFGTAAAVGVAGGVAAATGTAATASTGAVAAEVAAAAGSVSATAAANATAAASAAAAATAGTAEATAAIAVAGEAVGVAVVAADTAGVAAAAAGIGAGAAAPPAGAGIAATIGAVVGWGSTLGVGSYGTYRQFVPEKYQHRADKAMSRFVQAVEKKIFSETDGTEVPAATDASKQAFVLGEIVAQTIERAAKKRQLLAVIHGQITPEMGATLQRLGYKVDATAPTEDDPVGKTVIDFRGPTASGTGSTEA